MGHNDMSNKFILPPRKMFSITPNDSVDLPDTARCIWVGVSGDVQVTTLDDNVVVLSAIVAGMWHPMFVKRVWSTNTTATSIVGGM